MYAALAQHAAASRLPPRPLMAFWRFWEQAAAAQRDGADGPATPTCASLAQGREGEWDALALLLHMLAEGCTTAGAQQAPPTQPQQQQQQQLAALDATGTAVPAVLAYSAAQGADAAVQYAAARATAILAQLPSNLPLLLEAVLRAGQQAAAAATAGSGGGPGCLGAGCESGGGHAAGEALRLLWELSHSPGSGGTLPRAVALLQQHSPLLLACLEAALDPEQGRTAACRWLAAGLVASLTYEPPSSAGAAAAGGAAAADGMRRLLASAPAAGALHRLLALLEPDVASAHPQAAQSAALAVANLAAYRGLGQAPAGERPAIPEPSPGGMKAKLTGLTNRLLRPGTSPPSTPGGPSPHTSGDHAAHLWGLEGSGDYASAVDSFSSQQGAGEPRAALLHHGAVPKLLRLVLHCSAAAAAADATAAAAARAPAAPMLVQPTPLAAPTAAQQAAAAAAAAAESAAAQRAVLAAVLQAINNLCADPVRWLWLPGGLWGRLGPGLGALRCQWTDRSNQHVACMGGRGARTSACQ